VRLEQTPRQREYSSHLSPLPSLPPSLPNRVPLPVHNHPISDRGRVALPLPHVLILQPRGSLDEVRVLGAGLAVASAFNAGHVFELTRVGDCGGRGWNERGRAGEGGKEGGRMMHCMP